MKGNDDDNGPKRRQTRHLGPKVSVFFYIFVFFYTR